MGKILLIVFFLLLLQFQIWNVRAQQRKAKPTKPDLKILLPVVYTCQICSPESSPYFGCDQHQNGTEDEYIEDCTACGIWEEWRLNSDNDWQMLVRRRVCLMGKNNKPGCTYWYPAGTKGYVHEICKCIGEMCNVNRIGLINGKTTPPNNTNIMSLGGLGHPSKFPSPKRGQNVVLKVLNGANLQVNGVLHWIYFSIPLIYSVIIK